MKKINRLVHFRTEVFEGHKELVAFHVPFDPAKAWGKQDRYFVRGTMNRCAIEGEIGFRRGFHYMLLDQRLLKAAHVAVGDSPRFTLKLREAMPEEERARPKLTWARLAVPARKRQRKAKPSKAARSFD